MGSTEPLAADLIPAVRSIAESQTQIDVAPGKTKAPPGQGAMTDKEKADVMVALAKSAYQQYDNRTNTLYKMRIAVWTAFGVATWLILTTDKWKPGWIECVLGSLITIGIVLIVVFIWGRWTYPQTVRWVRAAHFWDSAIEYRLGVALPESFQPCSRWVGAVSRDPTE